MKAIDQPFTKIINGTMQFVIPVFQRDYSWTEAECNQLWKDILHVAAGESDAKHFLGSVVYIPTGGSAASFGRWMLIDGQQRVATLTLLLAALRDHIEDTDWSGGPDDPSSKQIEAYFLKNVQEEGDRRHKLVLRRRDHATLQALLDREPVPPDCSERIKDAYEFFREEIAETDPSEVYRGYCRLVVVDVTLDRVTDDPQLVFESLNSTGMDLSQSDLIRNYILMGLPERDQTNLYEKYWSKIEGLFRGSEGTFDSFARDYMALKTKANKQEKASQIYRSFRRFFDDLKRDSGGLDEALAEMLRFARYHASFSLGTDGSTVLAEPLSNLRRLVDVPATLVMRLFDCYERAGRLSEGEFVEALSLIESYVLRRAICGWQTRGYWQVFASLANRMDERDPLTSLKVGLARLGESYRFPTSDEFERELRDSDIYGLRVCLPLLERLENHGMRERTDTLEYSIEHIMPQNETLGPEWRTMLGDQWRSIQRIWLHRLGNLTLTGYNSSYSDRPFLEKKTIKGGFNESAVRLNKSVRECEVWTEREMRQRGDDLAARALEVWPELVVEQSDIEKASRREKLELAKRRDAQEVIMSVEMRELFDDLRKRVLELDGEIIELVESKSISYHGPNFFLEVLPRKRRLTLLVPLDFNEVDDPSGIVQDASQRRSFANARYEGGVAIRIRALEHIYLAMPIIRMARAVASV